jgi:hypothetical protein
MCTAFTCRYLFHIEGTLRTAANESLHTIIRTAPHLRNAVLMSVAAHISALPEDNMAVRVHA